jgi:metalloendopeptidase OMA1, mitochondrial
MISLLGAFWFWNQETVPITGRKRFNFIGHEYLEENEYQFFPQVFLHHLTMKILQDDRRALLPADHPMDVVVQKVFYQLLEAQGQDPSGWKISVIRAPGRSCPFTAESQRLILSDVNVAVAAANKQVLIYSGAFPVCQDEAGLACLMASQIAACIMERHSEYISHYYFVRFSAVPAIPLIISTFLFPLTAVITVPYIATWVVYAWNRDAALITSANKEDRYAGFIGKAKAGYDMHAGIGYWIRNLERAEWKIAENGRLNSPFHREVRNKSLALGP